MAVIEYQGRVCQSLPSETVLDTLLRNHHGIPFSCKAGSCGTCMMRLGDGQVPARAQSGLKDSWKARGYFLPCVCPADSDLKIVTPGDEVRVKATITQLTSLTP